MAEWVISTFSSAYHPQSQALENFILMYGPIKSPVYSVNPMKQKNVDKELRYMLDHGRVTRTYS